MAPCWGPPGTHRPPSRPAARRALPVRAPGSRVLALASGHWKLRSGGATRWGGARGRASRAYLRRDRAPPAATAAVISSRILGPEGPGRLEAGGGISLWGRA